MGPALRPDVRRGPELPLATARRIPESGRTLTGHSMPADSMAAVNLPERRWRYQVAGQGERPWHVYVPPHMTADAVRAYLGSMIGPLAIFERAEAQPKGALNSDARCQ